MNLALWSWFGPIVVLKVTLVALLILPLLAATCRRPATRHALALIAMIGFCLMPAITLGLPHHAWIASLDAMVAERPLPPVSSVHGGVSVGSSQESSRRRAALRENSLDETRASTAVDLSSQSQHEIVKQVTTSVSSGASDEPRLRDGELAGEKKSVRAASPAATPVAPSASSPIATFAWVPPVITLVWIGSSVLASLIWLGQWLRLCRWRTTLRNMPANELPPEIHRRVCRAVGLRTLPPLAVGAGDFSPVVIGVWKPTIVLPASLVREMSHPSLAQVLIHESAHVRRHDPWTHLLQAVAWMLYGWNPLVRYVSRELTAAREALCDDYVLSDTDAASFAQTLLTLARRTSAARDAFAPLGMVVPRIGLEARIARLLNEQRAEPNVLRWLVLGTVMLVGAVGWATGGVASAPVAASVNQPAVAQNDTNVARPTPQPERNPGEQQADNGVPGTPAKVVTFQGVCRADGEDPVAQALIRVFRYASREDAPHEIARTVTDSQGQFRLTVTDETDSGELGGETGGLMLAATAPGRASMTHTPRANQPTDALELRMTANVGHLRGTVRDEVGQPVAGATVYAPARGIEPVPDCRSAVTNAQGEFAIEDLSVWRPTATVDPKTGTGILQSGMYIYVSHPEFARTRFEATSWPAELKLTLESPAIVEGQVVDLVTGQTMSGTRVCVQGLESEWFATRTDERGRYRLRLTKGHFNMWAVAAERMPLAVSALRTEPGTRQSGVDIRMTRGGYVVGRLLDGATGQPVKPSAEKQRHIAHHGPARPLTGAAVSSTLLQPDGSFRLHVAPGRNLIYEMDGTSAAWVEVGDGQEVKLDLVTGRGNSSQLLSEDPDYRLRSRLLSESLRVRQGQPRPTRGSDVTSEAPDAANPIASSPPRTSAARDTKTGRLLAELDELQQTNLAYSEAWAKTLRQLALEGDVDAMIAKLDHTSNDHMLRCLGFALRVRGDVRAVPALIRAIPRTLLSAGSDLGLRIEQDERLLAFMQQHDLEGGYEPDLYSFARPVREIFGALQRLTNMRFDEEELYHVFQSGSPQRQAAAKRLFHSTAMKWSDWWEQEGAAAHSVEPAFARVNLPPLVLTEPTAITDDEPLVRSSGTGNWVLESMQQSGAQPRVAYDLDTGRAAALPAQWHSQDLGVSQWKEIESWARQSGFELIGDEYQAEDGARVYAIRGVGLHVWELGDRRWKRIPDPITLAELKAEGRAVDSSWLLHRDPTSGRVEPQRRATFLFETDAGTPGVLFIGIEVRDDSLQPGGVSQDDDELSPIAFRKGRRFGTEEFMPSSGK